MKNLNKLLFIAIIAMGQCNMAFTMSDDEMIDEFTVVQNVPEQAIEVDNSKTSSKSVNNSIANAKKMLTKAENSLNQIKDAVESDEVSKLVSTLKKMIFKNGPGFQITNKTEDPIWVSMVASSAISQDQYGPDQIAPGEKFDMELPDLNQDLMIGIYTQDPEVVDFDAQQLSPMPEYTFATTAGARGKTKYFTWNPAKHKTMSKFLYPQTGRLAGTVKVSSSSYNLDNNIKSFQLTLKEQK